MKIITAIFAILMMVSILPACSSERVPDTQRMERDTADKIMDTMPDMRLDTMVRR